MKLLLALALFLGSADAYEDLLRDEVVIDTARTYVVSSPASITDAHHDIVRSIARLELDPSHEPRKYYWFYFRTNDTNQVQMWKKVDRYNDNPLIRIRYLNAIARSGYAKADSILKEHAQNKNPIIREIAAANLAKLGRPDLREFCAAWLARETNGFVRETLLASIRRLGGGKRPKSIPYLSVTYAGIPSTDSLVYNRKVENVFQESFVSVDTSSNPAIPPFGVLGLPHQQYSFPLKGSPTRGGFGHDNGGVIHVGTDSGWLLEGLPVHSIANGRVRKIQHEITWGTFVAIESMDKAGKPFTTFYGHLDPDLEVSVGDVVTAGQQIGVIGKSYTVDNGGYISHLHLGIEARRFSEAHMKGYDIQTKDYRTVQQLMKE